MFVAATASCCISLVVGLSPRSHPFLASLPPLSPPTHEPNRVHPLATRPVHLLHWPPFLLLYRRPSPRAARPSQSKLPLHASAALALFFVCVCPRSIHNEKRSDSHAGIRTRFFFFEGRETSTSASDRTKGGGARTTAFLAKSRTCTTYVDIYAPLRLHRRHVSHSVCSARLDQRAVERSARISISLALACSFPGKLHDCLTHQLHQSYTPLSTLACVRVCVC